MEFSPYSSMVVIEEVDEDEESKSRFDKDLQSETSDEVEELTHTMQLWHFKVKSNSWIFSALMSGISAGVGSLFVGKASTNGFYARLLVSLGNLLAAAAYMFIRYTLLNYHPEDLNPEPHATTLKMNLKQKVLTAWAIVFDSIVNIGGGFLVILVFEYSYYASINQGIISTLFSFTSVYLSIFGWIIFREKINKFQVFGMSLLIIWAILYGFSGEQAQKSKLDVDQHPQRVSTFVPVILALWATVYFMARSLALKAFWVKFNFWPLDFMSLSYLTWGTVLGIPVLISFMHYGVDLSLLKDCLIGGFLQGFAMIFMYHAISTGYSGPAAALASVQAPVQTILAIVVLAQFPNSMQVVGLVLGVSGSVIISTGSFINEMFRKWKRHQE